MRESRERFREFGSGAVATALASWLFLACAQTDVRSAAEAAASYPEKRITLLSAVSPGGSTDLLARAVASIGPKYFGQPITVVTKEGGGGAVALQELLRRPLDGYTLAVTTSSGVVSNGLHLLEAVRGSK